MFSIIIPLYNKELSIEKTLSSVLDQTYSNFEVIIVNDGSTDNSIKVLEKFSDNRLRIIHQENKGVSSARNNGVKKAVFDWIAFIDGDDLWRKNHLEQLFQMIKSYPSESVFATSFAYSDNREILSNNSSKNPTYKIVRYFEDAIIEPVLWTGIVLVKNSAFIEAGGFNEELNRGEDLDLWARIAKRFSIIKSREITAIYRIEAENRTSLSDNLKAVYAYQIDIHSASNKHEVEYYKYIILSSLYNYTRSGHLKSSIRIFLKHDLVSVIDVLSYFSVELKKSFSRRLT